ncbi:hypothetical protein LXD69_04945 [Flavobacterium sediminilitoris]|uniref:Lipoprotein n=1 Tax=Flavobacterium sediminilitoris TaxID=2024526 RepID=A0ABY4HPQ9_9FLAO|nr:MULTISPECIES: hypothetical protein [Flavobacterium]UOX34859.1 hypothetical protein LXD69_04945 [Flavobacterium sediminilitoris]
MKAITILSALIITLSSCNCQKKATEATLVSGKENTEKEIELEKNSEMTTIQSLPLFEYESMSRGYFNKITVDATKLYVKNSSEGKPVSSVLSAEDIQALEAAYKEIDLEELPNLKAPTEKRFFDGAPMTNLKITRGDQVYQTPDFDGGSPPKYIEKLVNTILEIANKNK